MSIDKIQAAVEPLRRQLLEHPIYQQLESPAALRTFMRYHVFAVWDFMSLLKAVQRRICSVEIPWIPPANRAGCRLINEIVLAEESDDNGRGGHASHFDLYHRAMTQFGAPTGEIDRLLVGLAAGIPLADSLRQAEVPAPAARFVEHTFAEINSGDLCRMVSAFTFGREDLLPGVFQKIVDRLDRESGGWLGEFKYYLLRHIALDGGEHGPMATRLLRELCGADPDRWQTAEEAAVAALQARLEFWDGIREEVGRKG